MEQCAEWCVVVHWLVRARAVVLVWCPRVQGAGVCLSCWWLVVWWCGGVRRLSVCGGGVRFGRFGWVVGQRFALDTATHPATREAAAPPTPQTRLQQPPTRVPHSTTSKSWSTLVATRQIRCVRKTQPRNFA
jgi:hypothetical protein